MGPALLDDIFALGWPGWPAVNAGRATVVREVTKGHRIADLVVTAGPTTLVIENKVWSDESERQCEDLFELWVDGVSDVRLLLITLDGHPPRQTKSSAAAEAWRRLSYASLAAWLTARDLDASILPSHMAIQQYAIAIRRLARGTSPFQVLAGGGSIDARLG
jgi:hypothetical protein